MVLLKWNGKCCDCGTACGGNDPCPARIVCSRCQHINDALIDLKGTVNELERRIDQLAVSMRILKERR